jgi:hypothetical protein
MTVVPAPAIQREWVVKGLIVARHLPTTLVELMGVRIQPLDNGSKWTSDINFHLGAEVEEGLKGTPIAALPPLVGFQAYHELELRIRADTAREAATAGLFQFSRLAAALALAGALDEPGPVVSAESVEPTDGRPADEWRLPVRTANLVIDDADEAFVEGVKVVERLAAEVDGFSKLLDAWARTERFYLFAAESEDRRRALLAYSQVMEAVGNLVGAEVAPSAAAEEEAKTVIAGLAGALQGSLSTNAAKAAIRDAKAALDRIDVTTAGQRMRRAGEILGLNEPGRKAGADLWTLRSKKAGHDAADPVSNDEMVFARNVADEYFRKYADWARAKLDRMAGS